MIFFIVSAAKHDDDKHIFLSYNHDHSDMVHRVKNRLQQDGHKVWIDTEQMGGSTLEAMAEAVENAAIVLVCASDKYKQSPNCRTGLTIQYIFMFCSRAPPEILKGRAINELAQYK